MGRTTLLGPNPNDKTYAGLKIQLPPSLQVGESNGGDETEHDHEEPADDRGGDGDEYGAELAEEAEDYHDDGCELDHAPAANLQKYSDSFET